MIGVSQMIFFVFSALFSITIQTKREIQSQSLKNINTITQYSLQYWNHNRRYLTSSSFSTLNTRSITINSYDKSIYLLVYTSQNSNKVISLNDSRISVNNNHTQMNRNYIHLYLNMNKETIGQVLKIDLQQSSNKIQMWFQILGVFKLQMTALSTEFGSMDITKIMYSNQNNHKIILPQYNLKQIEFTQSEFQNSIKANFKHPQLYGNHHIQIKFLIDQQLTIYHNMFIPFFISTVSKNMNQLSLNITISDFANKTNINVSQFSSNLGSITVVEQWLDLKSIKLKITITQNINQFFHLVYSSQDILFDFVIKDIKCLQFQSVLTTSDNILLIQLYNRNNYTEQDSNLIIFSGTNFALTSTNFTDQYIILICNYSNKQQGFLNFTLDQNMFTDYKNNFIISLKYDKLFYFCHQAKDLLSVQKILQILCYFLDVLFIIIFVFLFIVNKKLLAVQSIFMIQMTYYSLIPINNDCPPYSGLRGFRYSTGYNIVTSINSSNNIHYSALLIQSNFFNNINLMLSFILLVPILYLIYKRIKLGQNFKFTELNKNPLLTFICESMFTILLFNSMNIYSSAVVQFQYLNNKIVLIGLIPLILSLPIMSILFLKLNKYFENYSIKKENTQQKYCFSLQIVNKINKYYPIILCSQMILISILLSLQSLFSISLYFVLVIQLLITITTCFVLPLYGKKKQRIRYFLYRIILIIICLVQIITLNTKQLPTSQINNYTLWSPILLFILLVCGISNTIFEILLYFIFEQKSSKPDTYQLNQSKINIIEDLSFLQTQWINSFQSNLDILGIPCQLYSQIHKYDKLKFIKQVLKNGMKQQHSIYLNFQGAQLCSNFTKNQHTLNIKLREQDYPININLIKQVIKNKLSLDDWKTFSTQIST